MEKKVLISVIMPVYNREKYLERAIYSVLNQSYNNLEFIIVDDGSKDKSVEIIESVKDKRIIFMKHENNKGACAARNTGIKVAKGKYIAFQDSDDEWLSNKLELQIEKITNTKDNIGGIYSNFEKISGEKSSIFPGDFILKKDGNISFEILKENFISTQTVMLKREVFDKIGMFDETLPRLQDWDLIIRIAQYYEFAYINKTLVKVYETPGNISSNPEKYIVGMEIILNKYKEIFISNEKNRKVYSQHLLNLGVENLILKEKKRSVIKIKESLRYNFGFKQFLILFVSMLCPNKMRGYFEKNKEV